MSRLCGHRHEPVIEPDGRQRYERVRVCPTDRLRILPAWHAVLIHRATPATIVTFTPAWTRNDLVPPPGRAQSPVTADTLRPTRRAEPGTATEPGTGADAA